MPIQQGVQIMGILNLTPDSFSDGGCWADEAALEARIEQLLAEGADIIDIGGESTRPFAAPVSATEELARILPVIVKIRKRSSIPLSIDTTKALVAREALAAGATMINDISALRQDPDMAAVARSFDGPVVIMHMQGTPGTMQVAPQYDNVVMEINAFFAERITWLEAAGVERQRIIVDPGIGFGKTLEHNLTILRNISAFKEHGCPVLIGHSRKAFFGQLLNIPREDRDWPTAMVSVFAAAQGADFLRVHQVQPTRQALRLMALLTSADPCKGSEGFE